MPNVYKSKVKVDGTWRTMSAVYVKVGGVWKLSTEGYTKVNGTWRKFYPYPLSADATVSSIKINNTTIANGGTFNAPSGTTSVTLSVTTSNSLATISGAVSGTGSASGSVSVSNANNPNAKTVTVTAEDGVTTATYTVYINVAAPAPTSVTIYYTYCTSQGTTATGSYTDTTTTSATTACANRQAALGYPSNWACGSTTPTNAICSPPPCNPCCQDTGEFTCAGYGVGRVRYVYKQYDPCCGTACPDRIVIVDSYLCMAP